MGKVLVFRVADRQQAPPQKTRWVDWVRLAAAHVLGYVELRPKWWDGNTLDALNDRMLRDVGLTRDEHDVVRRLDHQFVAPGRLDVLSRPGGSAMLDVAGRPTPSPNGSGLSARRW